MNLCRSCILNTEYNDLICIWRLYYDRGLLAIKIEILYYDPVVVLFHDFASESEYAGLLQPDVLEQPSKKTVALHQIGKEMKKWYCV